MAAYWRGVPLVLTAPSLEDFVMAKTAEKKGPDLFAKATKKADAEPKKAKAKKGTIIELPNTMGQDSREMTPDCRLLHDAVPDVIEQATAEKTAKGKQNTAKGKVLPIARELHAQKWLETGVQPETPVSIVNIGGPHWDKADLRIALRLDQPGGGRAVRHALSQCPR